MSRMTQNSANDHNFKVKDIENVKFYILNEFFVYKLKHTYIDFILCILSKNVETVFEITKKINLDNLVM